MGVTCCQSRPCKDDDLKQVREESGEPYLFPELATKATLNKPKGKVTKLELKNTHLLNRQYESSHDASNMSDSQINMYIDRFELTYRLIDDFGLEFCPRLNIQFTSNFDRTYEAKKKVSYNDDNDQDGEKSSRIRKVDKSKSVKHLDSHFLFNKKLSEISEKSEKSEKIDKEKNGKENPNNLSIIGENNVDSYNFSSNPIINLGDIKHWSKSKIKFTMININENNINTPITVGISTVEVSNLIKEYNKNFEGRISLFNKYNKKIGNLYIRIKIIQDNENQDNFNLSNMSFNCSNIDEVENVCTAVEKDDELLSEVNSYESLSPYLLELFIKDTNELKSKDIDYNSSKSVSDMLLKSILYNCDVITYEIIYFLNNKFESDDTDENNDFMLQVTKLINNKNNEFGLTILDFPSKSFDKKNIALIKIYIIFIHKIMLFNNKQLLINEKIEFLLDHEKLDFILIESYEIIINFLKESQENREIIPNSFEEKEEIHEIIVWLLNLITFLTQTLNPTDKLKKSEFYSKAIEINYNSCLYILKQGHILLSTFKIVCSDSQVASLICKIYRKSLHTVLEAEERKSTSEVVDILFLNNEKDKTILNLIEISFERYTHYPEVYANLLLILISISKLNDNEVIRLLLNSVKVNELFKSFESYKCKIKNISKTINGFFFEFLANITNTIQNSDITSGVSKNEARKICSEMVTIFKVKFQDNKYVLNSTLRKFISRKTYDIHESLSKIAMNLSKWPASCKHLVNDKCYLIPNMLEFFMDIKKSTIEKITAKTKRTSAEIEMAYSDIVDNTLNCFCRVINQSDETKNIFKKMLVVLNIKKQEINDKLIQISDISELFNSPNLRVINEEFTKLINEL